MKKLNLLAGCLMALFGLNMQAQTLIDWDENGQYSFYPEDLVVEGGITYDEDNACFISDGTEGKLLINLDGKTIDLSEVARIEVFGSEYKDNPWGNEDPIGTLTINDKDNGRVNRWFGSRYNVDYKDYAAKSAKVDSIYWDVRLVAPGEGEDFEPFYREGEIYIDEIVLTKSVEQDPMAITGEMWNEWDDCLVANANIVNAAVGGVKLNETLAGGAVFAGQMSGVVEGKVYADLTQYGGIYLKGTPGLQWRGLFNRNLMGNEGDFIEVVLTLNEDGEATLIFSENEALAAAPFIHLNTCKLPWGSPEGKFTKFNYVEKGSSAIDSVVVDAEEDENAPMYNVFGQRVDETYKGVVIKNGKKFINK